MVGLIDLGFWRIVVGILDNLCVMAHSFSRSRTSDGFEIHSWFSVMSYDSQILIVRSQTSKCAVVAPTSIGFSYF